MTAEGALTAQIDQAAKRLVEEFRGVAPEERVRALVMASADSLRDSRIADFVPLFIDRYVREQLKGVEGHVEEGHAGI